MEIFFPPNLKPNFKINQFILHHVKNYIYPQKKLTSPSLSLRSAYPSPLILSRSLSNRRQDSVPTRTDDDRYCSDEKRFIWRRRPHETSNFLSALISNFANQGFSSKELVALAVFTIVKECHSHLTLVLMKKAIGQTVRDLSFDLCGSIKHAVDWGNKKPDEAKAMGKAGQDFMESLSMDRIYDYMFNLITEYSKLLDYEPVPPPSAQEMCTESLLCLADPKQREFLERSISFPSPDPPCSLQPAKLKVIDRLIEQKQKAMNHIETMEMDARGQSNPS